MQGRAGITRLSKHEWMCAITDDIQTYVCICTWTLVLSTTTERPSSKKAMARRKLASWVSARRSALLVQGNGIDGEHRTVRQDGCQSIGGQRNRMVSTITVHMGVQGTGRTHLQR